MAATRGLKESDVSALVDSIVQGRELGCVGVSTVDALYLNFALAKLDPNGN